jgi:hypothetical protein
MSLSEILNKCRSVNGVERNNAEQQVEQRAMTDFGQRLLDCAQVMADESSVKENRQLCSTLIKNMILNNPIHAGKWEQLDPNFKSNIKNCVLSCLASNIKDVRKAAAITVAGKFNFLNLKFL